MIYCQKRFQYSKQIRILIFLIFFSILALISSMSKAEGTILNVFEYQIPNNGFKFSKGSDFIYTATLLLFEQNTYIIYFENYFDSESPSLLYERYYLSTGKFKRTIENLYLEDTINHYTFEFKLTKKNNIISTRGLQCFKNGEWKSVKSKPEYFDYKDLSYENFEKHGSDLNELKNKTFSVKYIPDSCLIGTYTSTFFIGSLDVCFYKDHTFVITSKRILISSGTWDYKFGRIDMYDDFFKHTFYCYTESDTSLFHINFPIIHTKKYEEDILVKVPNRELSQEEEKYMGTKIFNDKVYDFYRNYLIQKKENEK